MFLNDSVCRTSAVLYYTMHLYCVIEKIENINRRWYDNLPSTHTHTHNTGHKKLLQQLIFVKAPDIL